MEEQVLKQLSKNDQALLASIYEMEAYKSLIKAGDLYQSDKAKHISLTAPDMENVLLNRGMIHGARFAIDLIHLSHEKQRKAQG